MEESRLSKVTIKGYRYRLTIPINKKAANSNIKIPRRNMMIRWKSQTLKKSNSSGNKYVLDLWARIGRLIT